MLDCIAWPGASGSPVYDSDGAVRGVLLSTGRDSSTGLSFARPASIVTAFLREHGISPSMKP